MNRVKVELFLLEKVTEAIIIIAALTENLLIFQCLYIKTWNGQS